MLNKIIPPKQIRYIASKLLAGSTSYIQIYKGKIEFIDEDVRDPKQIIKDNQLLELVKAKPENYLVIGELPKEDLLESMSDFIANLKDASKRRELKNALNRKMPARNFLQAVNSDMEFAIYWKNFQLDWRQDWVSEFIIKAYNY